MPPSVKAAFLCDYALTSQDGKLSVLGIFSNINFPSLPNAYPRFFVVIIVALEVGQHQVHLGVVDPSGTPAVPEGPTVDVQVDVPGADTNLVIDFNNLPFQRAGIYQVQLSVDGRIVHSIPVSVQSAQAGMSGPAQA